MGIRIARKTIIAQNRSNNYRVTVPGKKQNNARPTVKYSNRAVTKIINTNKVVQSLDQGPSSIPKTKLLTTNL